MPLVRKPAAAASAPTAPADITRDLAADNAELRWSAARAAGGQPECAALLGAALRTEPVARVREAMFTSLARIGSAGVAALLPLLRSDDANLRTGALDALRILVREDTQLLPPLLQDDDVDVRILSCELARALPGDAATSLLADLLRHEADVNVCAAAVDVLAEVGQSAALPALADCAARFPAAPFLAFAVQVTADRINAGATRG